MAYGHPHLAQNTNCDSCQGLQHPKHKILNPKIFQHTFMHHKITMSTQMQSHYNIMNSSEDTNWNTLTPMSVSQWGKFYLPWRWLRNFWILTIKKKKDGSIIFMYEVVKSSDITTMNKWFYSCFCPILK